MITTSAPGKIVLCGEYAVLDGAPAIALAIDRRAVVRVSHSGDDSHRVTASGLTAAEGRFVTRCGRIEWLDGGAQFGLVDAVMQMFEPRRGLALELDTRAFVDDASGDKLGLGSSAALTVALLAALRESPDVFDDALAAHRSMQGGAGSGVDIATAVHGGLIAYRDESATRLRWPDGLAMRVVWTGVPASTRDKLARLRATGERASRQRLREAAKRMAAAWTGVTAVLDAFPGYIETLREFSVDHDLGIFDAGHGELVDRAASQGLVYKPCGAGGGDVGVLLGRSGQALDDFSDGGVLDCAPDSTGIVLEQQ